MTLAARLGSLSCALALIACGGSHGPGGDLDAGEGLDGGLPHDGGAAIDAGTAPDGGPLEGTCTGEERWPAGAHFGAAELSGVGEGPWVATISAVGPAGIDLMVEGRLERFGWPAGGLDGLSAGMQVELSSALHRSSLVAPTFALHAVHAAHVGTPPHEVFATPIEVEGAPAMSLMADCTFPYPDAPCGDELATAYTLEVDGVPLRAGQSASGPGYAIHFGGAATYPGHHGAGTDSCIVEAAFAASLGVRVDRAEEESCASIEARYAQILEDKASCEQPTDCRITSGHCGAGLGGCWYAVSGDVSELDELADRYRDLGCTSVVCRCTLPPESASCVAGRCVAD